MNKKSFYALSGITVLIMSAFFFGSNHGTAKAKPNSSAGQPSMSVTTITPQKREIPLTIEAFGTIAPWQEFSVSGEISGYRVSSIFAEVGDIVKKGQILAKFNDEMLKLDKAQLSASLEQATIKSQLSEEDSKRFEQLDVGNAASKQEVSSKKAQSRMDKANVSLLKAQIASIETKLRNTSITAPDDGTISSRNVVSGTFPAQGFEMFRIIRQGRLEWRAEIPSKSISSIKQGANALVHTAELDIEGKVRKISPLADDKSRSFIVYIDAKLPPSTSGIYASGSISIGNGKGLFVPSSSVRVVDGRATVPTVEKNKNPSPVKRAIVETGLISKDGMTQIIGLPEDAQVVNNGAGFLNEGDVVYINNNNAEVGK